MGGPRLTPKPCKHCGKLHKRQTYCSKPCYYAAIHNPSYVQWRQGQRHARATVTDAGFTLQPGHIIHHVDSDNRNNTRQNLWVFASHGDHMAYHRLGYEMMERQALWKG